MLKMLLTISLRHGLRWECEHCYDELRLDVSQPSGSIPVIVYYAAAPYKSQVVALHQRCVKGYSHGTTAPQQLVVEAVPSFFTHWLRRVGYGVLDLCEAEKMIAQQANKLPSGPMLEDMLAAVDDKRARLAAEQRPRPTPMIPPDPDLDDVPF
jgi:hypothetical protein